MYFSSFIESTNSSVAQALQKSIKYILNQDREVLAAHMQNANQASGEFIYQETPP
ncbi:8383_t:CDS:2, partial [Gigaspora margarita]